MAKKTFERWYADLAKKQDLDSNPNHPLHFYDYRGAWKAGHNPDEDGHLPSKFKHDWHPNRFITKSPKTNDPLPKGFFWDTKTDGRIVSRKYKERFDTMRDAFTSRASQEEEKPGSGF